MADGAPSGIGHNVAAQRAMDQAAYATWVSIEEARKELREQKAELKEKYVDARRHWPAVEAAFRQQYREGAGGVFTDEFMITFGNLGPGEQLNALDVIDPDREEDLQAAYGAGKAHVAEKKSKMADNPYHPLNQRNLYGRWKQGWLDRQAELAHEMAPADEGGEAEHLEG